MNKMQELLRGASSATDLDDEQILYCEGLVDTLCRTVLMWNNMPNNDEYKYFSHLLVALTGLSVEHFLLNLLPSVHASAILETQVRPSRNSDKRRKKATKNMKTAVKGLDMFTHKTTNKKEQTQVTVPSAGNMWQYWTSYRNGVGGTMVTEKLPRLLVGVEDLNTQKIIKLSMGCRDAIEMAAKYINMVMETAFEGEENVPLKLKDYPIPLKMSGANNASERTRQHMRDTRNKRNFPALCLSLRRLLNLTYENFDPTKKGMWVDAKQRLRTKHYKGVQVGKDIIPIIKDSNTIFRGLNQDALKSYFTVDEDALEVWMRTKTWNARDKAEDPFAYVLTSVYLKYSTHPSAQI